MDKVKELNDAWESTRKIMNHTINELKKENELLKYDLEQCKEIMYEHGIVLRKDYEKMRKEGEW